MTLAINLAIAGLLALALLRAPGVLTIALATAFLAAVGAAQIAPELHIKPILMGLDALIVLSAWTVWTKMHCGHANLVAWLGLCKILIGMAASFSIPYLVWASVNNALFVVMILVAGGFTDGIIAWLGHRLLKPDARGARLLRYMEWF